MKTEFEINKKTRKVYLNQHNNYLADDIIFKRFMGMVSDPAYFHLTKKDFKGAKILDAGCGNTAYFEVAMHRYGVREITCLDLGKEWIAPLSAALKSRGVPENKVKYVSGSTDKLPFPDNSFDITFSNGVLMHLASMDQIKKAFRELARVTKPGGYFYVIFGNPGGLLEKEVWPALRQSYRSNDEFKDLIDNLTPGNFTELFNTMADGMKKNTGEKFNYSKLAPLFDLDFCTTLQNLIQVPKRFILEITEDVILDWFRQNNFIAPKRCKRFVKRKNIRKFFAPLHYDNSTKFSKLLYGPGNLEFIARKKS